MQSATQTAPVSKTMLWAGRIISVLVVVFLLFDALIKVMSLPPAIEGTTGLGYPESLVFGIGLLELVCVVLYVIPRTSILGAILLTGYLGGGAATKPRLGKPLFTYILSSVSFCMLILGLIFFHDSPPRAPLPLSRYRLPHV